MRIALLATGIAILALPGAAQAACDCQDVDKDGYPDNGNACTGTFAEKQSVWNPAPGTRDLRIRFTWSQTRSCGMFANGDYWVAVPSGNLELTSMTPALANLNGRTINGYQKNLYRRIAGGTEDRAPRQSLDSGSGAAFTPPPAVGDLDPEPGDAVIKVIGRRSPLLPGDGGDSAICDKGICIDFAAFLTVLGSAPTNSHLKFRPPVAGRVDFVEGSSLQFVTEASQQIRPIYSVSSIDFASFYPRRSCSACGPYLSGTYSVERMRDRFSIPHAIQIREDNRSRNFRPVAAFGVLGDNAYGGDYTRDETKYAILMALDAFDPDPVARNAAYHAAINHIQVGIDYIHAIRDGNYFLSGGGGHHGGMSLAMWHAAAALRHPDLLAFMADPFYRFAQGAVRANVDRGVGTPYDDDSLFMSRVVDAGGTNYFAKVRDASTGAITGNAHVTNGPALYGQACGSKRKGPTSCSGSGSGGCTRCDLFCDDTSRSNAHGGGGNTTQCSDPGDLVDGGGHVMGGSDYEKEHLCGLVVIPIAVRLFAGGDDAWAMPESYEYAIRRWRFGIWTLPDGFGGSGGKHGSSPGLATSGQLCSEIGTGSTPGKLMMAFRDTFWDADPVPGDGSQPPPPPDDDPPPPADPPPAAPVQRHQ